MDSGAGESRFWDGEVVAFFLVREEAEIVRLGYGLNGDAPIGSALNDCGGDGVMVTRLNGVTDWFLSCEKPVDQNPSATPLVAADHDAIGVSD